ncbi:MAG TPA: pentapeptide repeat-containing protein [Tepidisphaeraceae bacterium]|jgi:hypothetical protein
MSEFFEHHEHHSHLEARRRPRPKRWTDFRASIRHRWLLPFLFVDWLAEWAAYGLSRMSILELLEYCSSFSLLIAVIFYFVEAPQRTKLRHYQAWQVINSAQGKGGSGGRIEALRELNEDHVSLLGVDVSDAFLQGVDLHDANLARADFSGADLRNANLRGANLGSANLHSANLINAQLVGANLEDANLEETDLENADLQEIKNWQNITKFRNASIDGIRNAPPGFIEWAIKHGAVQTK